MNDKQRRCRMVLPIVFLIILSMGTISYRAEGHIYGENYEVVDCWATWVFPGNITGAIGENITVQAFMGNCVYMPLHVGSVNLVVFNTTGTIIANQSMNLGHFYYRGGGWAYTTYQLKGSESYYRLNINTHKGTTRETCEGNDGWCFSSPRNISIRSNKPYSHSFATVADWYGVVVYHRDTNNSIGENISMFIEAYVIGPLPSINFVVFNAYGSVVENYSLSCDHTHTYYHSNFTYTVTRTNLTYEVNENASYYRLFFEYEWQNATNFCYTEDAICIGPILKESNVPKGYIDHIIPNSTRIGTTVQFVGHGSDFDGNITDYRWYSNVDRFLSYQNSFNTSTLSVGNHTIYFKVRDNDGVWSDETVGYLVVKPPNKNPTVEITYPVSGQTFKDEEITLAGIASDPDGHVQKVEVRIDEGHWLIAKGTTSWGYSWDSTTIPDGYHTIYVKGYDGENYSNIDSITINVDNTTEEARGAFVPGFAFVLLLAVIWCLGILLTRKR